MPEASRSADKSHSATAPLEADVVDSPEIRAAVLADAQLVQECLAGGEAAWERLYLQCHPRLCEAIGYMLKGRGPYTQIVEEIAARVWYALLRDSGRLLAKFDAERNCRLGVFLVGLARNEILQYMRTERRRRRREHQGGRMRLQQNLLTEEQMATIMEEFALTLTANERSFLERFLLAPVGEDGSAPECPLSRTNVWQRRHRIREKLKAYLRS